LEMVGIPYVGSGPLAHSLALDKVVSKMLFRQHGLPTPDFAVLEGPGFPLPDLPFPLIVKPKNESTSLGLRIVDNAEELRSAANIILEEYSQPVLAEEYIEGREINVGLIGNGPPEVFPPAELMFGKEGPPIYTLEDKQNKSGREVQVICPADLSCEQTAKAQELALIAFKALGCADCARIDMRLSARGELTLLELNSLPSLGERGSYAAAARRANLDFAALINRLVEEASARYFGTPHPPKLTAHPGTPRDRTFAYLTQRRDRLEGRLRQWVALSSHTQDPISVNAAFTELGKTLTEIGLQEVPLGAEERVCRLWETGPGYEDGTLLLVPVDVPTVRESPHSSFRRDPEWLIGEGIGVSRAPLVMLEFGLRAVKAQGKLKRASLGVLAYGDEGEDCRSSGDRIRDVAGRARCVLILVPGTPGGKVVVGRRGLRKFRLVVEGPRKRLGQAVKGIGIFPWICEKIASFSALTSRTGRIAVAPTAVRTLAFPMLLPHRVELTLLVGYAKKEAADRTERQVREILNNKGVHWTLEVVSDRPPMAKRTGNMELAKAFVETGKPWEIVLQSDTSTQPSAAGLMPDDIPTLCGLGPTVVEPHTPQEAVQRISLMRRTLLLAQYLIDYAGKEPSRSPGPSGQKRGIGMSQRKRNHENVPP
ncbi:MAG: M20/M25/M40 family metallo-hydrolase, partial [Planctomycetota bacterium]